jgi:hypothetical protein
MRLLYFCTLVLFYPSLSWGAVVLDANSSGSGTATTNITWSHTVTGANTLIICLAAIGNGGNVSAFTVNAQALTLAGTRASGAVPASKIEMWYRIAPTSGTVSLTLASSADRVVGGCTSFTGADQTTPLGTVLTNPVDDSVDASAISVTVPTNGLGYGGVLYHGTTAACTAVTMVNGAMVRGFDTCVGVAGDDVIGSSATRPSTGGISWANEAGANRASIAVPLSPSVGGAPTRRRVVVIQ